MIFKPFFFFVTMYLNFGLGECIVSGQKISILQIPFIVLGQGMVGDELKRFSGVIVDEKLVLTAAAVPRHYKDINITVGVSDVRLNVGSTYQVRRYECNHWVALLEIDDALFQFSDQVQKASLVVDNVLLKHRRPLYAAGYGSVNWYNTHPHELHYTDVYVSYEGLSPEWHKQFFLMTAKRGRDLSLGHEDLGGPVWDRLTGEVVGLIYDRVFTPELKNYHMALSLGIYREWIEKARKLLYTEEDCEGSGDEDGTGVVGGLRCMRDWL